MKRLTSFTLMLLIAVANFGFCEEQTQKAARLDTQIKVQMDYLLALPKNYEKENKFPLILFLHGAGERGSNLEAVKTHGPPKLISEGKEFAAIVVSPQCPNEKWWQPHELIALLDDIEARYKIDPDRIYVTGLSMGGFGTWSLAATIPHRIAAIAPICGGGELFIARRLETMPIWAFHGRKDDVVPVSLTENLIEAIRKRGGNPKLTIYPEADHDSWTETYNNPEFYEWLFAQKRKSN